MHARRAFPRGARLFLTIAALAALGALARWDPVALLLSAPWLLAIAWVIARNGLDAVAPGDSEPLPSGAELQLRRR